MCPTKNLNIIPHIIAYTFPQLAELQVSAHDDGQEITIAQLDFAVTKFNCLEHILWSNLQSILQEIWTGLSLHSRQKGSQRKFLFVQNMNFQEETSGDAQSPISQEPEHSSGMEVRKY